jgi:hypothetical protein
MARGGYHTMNREFRVAHGRRPGDVISYRRVPEPSNNRPDSARIAKSDLVAGAILRRHQRQPILEHGDFGLGK